MKKKPKPIILLDMDGICVDMTPTWLKIHYERTGEKLLTKNQSHWAFGRLSKYPRKLNKIYEEDGFFANLPPIANSPEYISKFLEKKADVIFLTQLPRKSEFAAKDKRAWVEKFLPKFDQRNIIFAHRKALVNGDVLFDDNPIHLETWKAHNIRHLRWPMPQTATIQYAYNKNTDVDWVFKTKSRAWKDFYEKVCDYYDL
jgi:5'(3')-deoxyribonucleotidase